MMKKNPITVDSDTYVLDAQKMMRENNIRRLPVVDKGKLVGIVTNTTSLWLPLTGYFVKYSRAQLPPFEDEGEGIMKKNPLTFSPDTPFEKRCVSGRRKRLVHSLWWIKENWLESPLNQISSGS